MGRGKSLRLSFAMVLVLAGAVLVLLNISGPAGELLSKLGLAFIVAGIVSAYREIAISRLEAEDRVEDIAEGLRKLLPEFRPKADGMHMIASTRGGYPGYYTWVNRQDPQILFFAGRSVLHGIDRDFRGMGMESAEQVLKRKLVEGSNISILFFDPRSDELPQLARMESQAPETVLAHIATSVGICRRLYELLKENHFDLNARLIIRISSDIPYFAYHREDDTVIVGFYFATAPGSALPAFEVLDDKTKLLFERHFANIFERAFDTQLLEFLGDRSVSKFNEALFNDLYVALVGKLGREEVESLISGGGQGEISSQ